MGQAEVRLYAELNDFVPREKRQRPFRASFDGSPAVKDLIESVGVPHTEVDLVLVNGESVGFERRVVDGDRISVYPVFEAFDVGGATRVRERPLRDPRFIADVHLGKLARHLRLLGFDVTHGEVDDGRLARASQTEHRILLTRDVGLLKRSQVTHGCFIRSQRPSEQLVEVVERFHLASLMAPFTRCLECNGVLTELAAEQARRRVPSWIAEHHQRFRECARCGRIFWQGTHHPRLSSIVEQVRSLAR